MSKRSFSPADDGYVEVNVRIEEFYKKYPKGSIQSEIVELSDSLVVMKAYAYRTPDDERPGIGHSQMPIPGLTPFTKNSEVENAETSAWGRAIAALGFEVKRSIASAEEVANKKAEETTSAMPLDGDATPAQKVKLMAEGKRVLGSEEAVRAFVLKHVGKYASKDLTKGDMDTLFTELAVAAATSPSASA